MVRLLPEIETMLLGLLGLQDTDNPPLSLKKLRSLSTRLYKLSNEFVMTGSGKGKYQDAYLAYHFPTNFMKSWMISRWLQNQFPQWSSGKKRIRILDIGCGHGAGMFGTYYALKQDRIAALTGVDRSAAILHACRKIAFLMKKNDRRLHVRLHRHRLHNALQMEMSMKFDVVILANALAEIEQDEHIPQKYIKQIFRHVTADGIVVIIEPASRMLSRRLMHLREQVLRETTYHIMLPCLHENTCPLIAARKGKEWCHQSLRWQPPRYMKMLNQPLHREIDRLKFANLVLSKKKYRERNGEDILVISDLLVEKGRKKCFLCTPTGRVELVRQNASQKTKNEDFDLITRGDIINLDAVKRIRPDGWRIEPSSRITIKPSAI